MTEKELDFFAGLGIEFTFFTVARMELFWICAENRPFLRLVSLHLPVLWGGAQEVARGHSWDT